MLKKILVLFMLLIPLLAMTAIADNGDVYYFTDTDVDLSFDTSQFGIFMTLVLFFFFFYLGYTSQKRSGGGFMIVSAFMFLSLEALLLTYIDAVLVIPFMSPMFIFILILGIRKMFYPIEGNKTKTEGG